MRRHHDAVFADDKHTVQVEVRLESRMRREGSVHWFGGPGVDHSDWPAGVGRFGPGDIVLSPKCGEYGGGPSHTRRYRVAKQECMLQSTDRNVI